MLAKRCGLDAAAGALYVNLSGLTVTSAEDVAAVEAGVRSAMRAAEGAKVDAIMRYDDFSLTDATVAALYVAFGPPLRETRWTDAHTRRRQCWNGSPATALAP